MPYAMQVEIAMIESPLRGLICLIIKISEEKEKPPNKQKIPIKFYFKSLVIFKVSNHTILNSQTL